MDVHDYGTFTSNIPLVPGSRNSECTTAISGGQPESESNKHKSKIKINVKDIDMAVLSNVYQQD